MPILKRLNDQDDEPVAGNGESRTPRRVEPEIIRGRAGYASVSLGALRERIEQEVQEELAARSDILLDAQDEAVRRALVREIGEYLLAVETVTLGREERDRLFDAVYSNLFSFGPLDALLADERVTELTADGHARLYIRRRMGPPEPVPSHFEDAAHLVRILERILTSAGGELRDDQPFVEIGVTLLDRPARLTLILPPLSPEPHVDVRLHPRQPIALESLLAQGALSAADADLLRALARSPHGVCLAGEAATGKTTLLQALLAEVPDPGQAIVVERAREVRLSEGMRRRAAVPAHGDDPGLDFGGQIAAALDERPGLLAVDELRGDESGPIWAVLSDPAGPRCLAVLRTSPVPARMRSALGILLRKGQPTLAQAAINAALLERLPFVVTTHFAGDQLHVSAISEWTATPDGQDIALQAVIQQGQPTGYVPRHAL